MSSRDTATPKEVQTLPATAAPAWLAEIAKDDHSLDAMGVHRVLQRIKVLQGISNADLKDKYGEGATILSPANVLVAKKGDVFTFAPLFFFTEYCKWADINDKSVDFPIITKTYDPSSEVAKKSRKPETRREKYVANNRDYFYQYVEHLNWAGMIVGEHPLAGEPICLTFARGEFSAGQKFVNQIMMRKVGGRSVPLWAQLWDLKIGTRKNKAGQSWYGLDAYPPEDGKLFVAEDQAPIHQGIHKELAQQHAERRLSVDRSDEGAEEVVANNEM